MRRPAGDLEYLENVAAEAFCRAFPRRFAYWIGLRAADVYYRRDARGRAAVRANIRHILEFGGRDGSDAVVDRMARATFRQFGKHVVDFFRLIRVTREDVGLFVTSSGMERVGEALSRGTGAIMLSAHLGNWELGGAALSFLGHPVNAVFMPKSNPKVDRLFRECREKRGMKVMPLGSAARATLAALKRKELVCLLADRDYTARAVVQEFFGAPARFPMGPARLCIHTGAPIVMGFTLRRDDDTFSMCLEAPIWPESGMTVEDVQRRICDILQKVIAGNPCQWFMFEDFWHNGGSYGRNGH